MHIIFFIIFFSESKSSKFNAIGSQLFLRNTSLLFDRQAFMKMPGEIICIPTLSTYRVFSIKNLRVIYNIEHLITNSEFLQNYQLQISNCYFSNFLRSPISIKSQEECISVSQKYNESQEGKTVTLKDVCFTNCYSSEEGGAIYVEKNNIVSIGNCTFTNCSSSHGKGGAIYIDNCFKVRIIKCRFEDCLIIFADQIIQNFGGGVCIENVFNSISLNEVNFENCTSERQGGGGGIFVINSNSISLRNINFFNCSSGIRESSKRSDGGGALIQNVSHVDLHKIYASNCSATMGSGVSINTYSLFKEQLALTEVKGEFLSSSNSICSFGYYAFHYCNFLGLYSFNISDPKFPDEGDDIFSIYISYCKGNLSNLYFETNDHTYGILCQSIDEIKFDYSQLYITCVIAQNATDFDHIFAFDLGQHKPNISIHLLKYNPTHNPNPSYSDGFSFEKAQNSNCLTITQSSPFTVSDEFSLSAEFSLSVNFSESIGFSESEVYSDSSEFTNSHNFSASHNFTYTYGFTETLEFTASKTFSPSYHFGFTTHDHDEISPSASDEPIIPLPPMTGYNMRINDKDGLGTKTDLGQVSAYIILALLIVLLIVAITIVVINARKPLPEEYHFNNDPDEFYFPEDFNE